MTLHSWLVLTVFSTPCNLRNGASFWVVLGKTEQRANYIPLAVAPGERSVLAHEIQSVPVLEPILAEEWLPQSASVQQVYLQDVRSCPIYVGLFGCTFSEPTKLEYLAASENPYRERLVYLKECAAIDPPLQELIKTFESQVTFKRFRSLADLLPIFSQHLLAALNRMIGNYQKLGEPKPVAHGGGAVLERRWTNQRRFLSTLGLPGDLSPDTNESIQKALLGVLNEGIWSFG